MRCGSSASKRFNARSRMRPRAQRLRNRTKRLSAISTTGLRPAFTTASMDRRTPLPGLELCAKAAREAYDRAGAKEKFVLRVQENTGHKVTDASLNEAI